MNSAARQGHGGVSRRRHWRVQLWPIGEPASERQVDGTIRGVSLVVIRRVLPEHIRRLRKLWPIGNVRIRAIGHLRIRIGTGDGRKDDCGTDRRRDQPGSVLDRCSHGWFCPSDDFRAFSTKHGVFAARSPQRWPPSRPAANRYPSIRYPTGGQCVRARGRTFSDHPLILRISSEGAATTEFRSDAGLFDGLHGAAPRMAVNHMRSVRPALTTSSHGTAIVESWPRSMSSRAQGNHHNRNEPGRAWTLPGTEGAA